MDLSHHFVRALERGEAPPQVRAQWTADGAAAWEARLLEGGASMVPGALRREGLPQRLAEALCEEAGVPLDRRVRSAGASGVVPRSPLLCLWEAGCMVCSR